MSEDNWIVPPDADYEEGFKAGAEQERRRMSGNPYKDFVEDTGQVFRFVSWREHKKMEKEAKRGR